MDKSEAVTTDDEFDLSIISKDDDRESKVEASSSPVAVVTRRGESAADIALLLFSYSQSLSSSTSSTSSSSSSISSSTSSSSSLSSSSLFNHLEAVAPVIDVSGSNSIPDTSLSTTVAVVASTSSSTTTTSNVVSSPISSSCGICEDVAAFRCTTCNEYLCTAHAHLHRKERGKTNHVVLTMKAFLDNNQGSITCVSRCELHPSHQLKFYCINHSASVCLECVALLHSSCARGDLLTEFKKSRKQLNLRLAHVRDTTKVIKNALDKLAEVIDTVKNQRATLCTAVEQEFSQLSAAVEERRKRLLIAVDEQTNKKVTTLELHQNTMQWIIAKKESVTDETERVLKQLDESWSPASVKFMSVQYGLHKSLLESLESHPEMSAASKDLSSMVVFETTPRDQLIQAMRRQEVIINKDLMSVLDYQVNDVVDAQDTRGTWYAGVVLATNAHSVQVRFNGWTAKWDEWIPKISDRLLPVNTKSLIQAPTAPAPASNTATAPVPATPPSQIQARILTPTTAPIPTIRQMVTRQTSTRTLASPRPWPLLPPPSLRSVTSSPTVTTPVITTTTTLSTSISSLSSISSSSSSTITNAAGIPYVSQSSSSLSSSSTASSSSSSSSLSPSPSKTLTNAAGTPSAGSPSAVTTMTVPGGTVNVVNVRIAEFGEVTFSLS